MQLVDNVFRSLSKGDYEALTRNVAEHFDLWAVQDGAELPWSGHFQGKEGIKAFFQALNESLDQAFSPDEAFVENDKVVVTGRSQATVRASGKRVEQEWVMVWTLRNGEILACKYFDDSAKWVPALQAAG
jgi:uncharacterized protein